MEEDFKLAFLETVEHILNPENLKLKSFNGTNVTVSEFFTILKELILLILKFTMQLKIVFQLKKHQN